MRKIQVTLMLAVFALSLSALGCGDKVPDSADGVVKASIDAVKANEPGKIYAMLPASYHKDIQGMVKIVADGVDKETYNNAMNSIDKLISGADKHKAKLLEQVVGMAKMKKEDVEAAFTELKTIWKILKDSGITTHAGLAKLDVGAFLKDNGKALVTSGRKIATMAGQAEDIKKFDEMAAKVKVEVKEAGEDKTTLTLTTGEHKSEILFVKVEDRWIPEDLSKMWKPAMTEANKNLAEGLKEYEGKKDELKKMSAAMLEAATKFEETGDPTALMGMAAAF
jgi:hypothetical protein